METHYVMLISESYHDESHRILAKAKKEFARKQEEGYSREEAVQEFLEVQESIRKQL